MKRFSIASLVLALLLPFTSWGQTESLAVRIRNSRTTAAIPTAEAIESLQRQLNTIAGDIREIISGEQAVGAATEIEAPSYGPKGVTITSLTKVLTDPSDFGLRFWAVRAMYMTNMPDLTAVAVWVEEPTDDPATLVRNCTYIPGGENTAIIALDIPDETLEIRVYLVPVTDHEWPLRTVALYGAANASSHGEIEITPLPTETVGVEWTSNVTAFTMAAPTYFYDANGIYRGRLMGTFTEPADARWGGIELVAKRPGPIYELLGRFRSSPIAGIVVECPFVIESWRIFARSFDKQGKTNTINEGGDGTPTPYDDISIGNTDGKLDLGKALDTSLAAELEVVAQVLGVKDEGITEALIKDFAISKLKLKNAPIIDAVRIENLAVATAHIQAAAITTALLHNLAVTEAKIADATIGTAKIKNLAVTNALLAADISADKISTGTLSVDKIDSWEGKTIQVGSGTTFSGTVNFGGSVNATIAVVTGALTANTPAGTAVAVNSGSAIMYNGQFVGAGGVNTAGTINTGSSITATGSINTNDFYKVDGVEVISTDRIYKGSGGVNTIGDHNTNGVFKVDGTQVVTNQGAVIADVSGTADGTYDATEQAMLNDLVTAVNALISRMEGHGLIAQ